MHKKHFYHSDVRWPNIICYIDAKSRDSKYLLIDFENVKWLCSDPKQCDHKSFDKIDQSKLLKEFKKIIGLIYNDDNPSIFIPPPIKELIDKTNTFFRKLKEHLTFDAETIDLSLYNSKMEELHRLLGC
jgi:hypothetical protein